jgi:N-acetylmuramoyl-L-alanine amidase
MLAGVTSYFRQNPPAGTLYAMLARQQADVSHIIQDGETISAIAQKYNVNSTLLRQFNGLDTNRIFPGQVLRIPLPGNS